MADEAAIPVFELSGYEDIPATYTDVFVVAYEKETDMSTVYFFQRYPYFPEEPAGTVQDNSRKARCVGRMLFSRKGMVALLEALAQNQGLALTPRTEGEN